MKTTVRVAWLAILWGTSAAVTAAELSVFSAGAVKPALSALIDDYQKASGHTLVVEYAPVGVLLKRLSEGAQPDVLVVTTDVIDDLQRKGWTLPNSAVPLGSVGVGVAMRDGAKAPDISSPEALKQTILAARSITYIDPTKGTSGKHFAEVLQRLGIAEQVKGKTVLGDTGYVVEPVARGEVELGFQQIPEILPVQGVTLVGPLPAPLQKVTTYVVAQGIRARDADAVKDLVAFLGSRTAQQVFRQKGFAAP